MTFCWSLVEYSRLTKPLSGVLEDVLKGFNNTFPAISMDWSLESVRLNTTSTLRIIPWAALSCVVPGGMSVEERGKNGYVLNDIWNGLSLDTNTHARSNWCCSWTDLVSPKMHSLFNSLSLTPISLCPKLSSVESCNLFVFLVLSHGYPRALSNALELEASVNKALPAQKTFPSASIQIHSTMKVCIVKKWSVYWVEDNKKP